MRPAVALADTVRYLPVSLAKELLLSDIGYSAWANRNLLDACSALAREEFEPDLRVSHTSILSTLRHIYDAERVWLLCLRDTPDPGAYLLPPGPAPELSLDALTESWLKVWGGYRRWLQDQSEISLSVELIVQLPGSEPRLSRWKSCGTCSIIPRSIADKSSA